MFNQRNYDYDRNTIIENLFALKRNIDLDSPWCSHMSMDDWNNLFWETVKEIKNLWVGTIRECEEPFSTAECLARELIYHICDILHRSDYLYEKDKDSFDKVFDFLLDVLPNSAKLDEDFEERYKKYYLSERDFNDGIKSVDEYFETRKGEWMSKVEKIINNGIDDIYLNFPEVCVNDVLVKADREYMLKELRREITEFDQNIWLDIYKELKSNDEVVRQLIYSLRRNMDQEYVLLRLAENDRLYMPTSFTAINWAIADHAFGWRANDYYSLYEYKYALDYCKWRAGYIEIEQIFKHIVPDTSKTLNVKEAARLIEYSGIREGSKASLEVWGIVLEMLGVNSRQTLRSALGADVKRSKFSEKIQEKLKLIEIKFDDEKAKLKEKRKTQRGI